MSEVVEKKKKLKGFGSILEKTLKPLETNEAFLEKYGNISLKILLNTTDGKFATLIKFEDGKVNLESVSNEDKKNLKKKVLLWDGMMATTTPIFLKMAAGDLGESELKKLVVSRKLKIKGTDALATYREITDLLR